jgi:hypothetical protein
MLNWRVGKATLMPLAPRTSEFAQPRSRRLHLATKPGACHQAASTCDQAVLAFMKKH